MDYNDICLTPEFMTYLNSKTAKWMVQNSAKYEYDYIPEPPKSKLFKTMAEAQQAADYVNSVSYEIDAVFPYDDTANERYSKLGIGWEFDFPYVETRYGYDDVYEYLHFGSKGTYLIDLSSDGGENHLAGYPLNDIKLTYDTSVTHDGERSKYLVTEKDGTKHYFGKDGRLLYQEDRFGNRIKFYCDTESYMNVWGKYKEYPYIKKIVDTVGREVVFSSDNETNEDITLKMTITNPNNAEEQRIYKYYLDKLSQSQIGIMGNKECNGLNGDEWVLKYFYDAENQRTRYSYNYIKTKFSFLDRNNVFYNDYYDARDSAKGNSYINNNNFEEFNGIHNVYAVVTGAAKKGI